MTDVLFLGHGRPEFTEASLRALLANTSWSDTRLIIYTDGPPDRMVQAPGVAREIITDELGGPVAIMNHYLARRNKTPFFAKVDNDVICPPGWLAQALAVMRARPELGLLGLEPARSRTPAPWGRSSVAPEPEDHYYGPLPGYAACDSIGGVGVMRSSAFLDRRAMQPRAIYGGFTDWQLSNADIVKGWIVPTLKLFLLDRLPVEPWASLSRKYIAAGEQRPWTNYPKHVSALWDWWKP